MSKYRSSDVQEGEFSPSTQSSQWASSTINAPYFSLDTPEQRNEARIGEFYRAKGSGPAKGRGNWYIPQSKDQSQYVKRLNELRRSSSAEQEALRYHRVPQEALEDRFNRATTQPDKLEGKYREGRGDVAPLGPDRKLIPGKSKVNVMDMTEAQRKMFFAQRYDKDDEELGDKVDPLAQSSPHGDNFLGC